MLTARFIQTQAVTSKHARRVFVRGLLGLVISSFVFGCAGGGAQVESPTVGTPLREGAAPGSFPEDEREWGSYHSKRFALSVPLPARRDWKIDDHAHRELVASHEKTRSSLVLYAFSGTELMNRQRCEAKSRELGLVPEGELTTVGDEVTVGPEAYDTRVWVALRVGKSEQMPIVGHVMGFGAYIRKCLFFHFTTEVRTAKEESVLSSRLALSRLRMLGRITLDVFDDVPREKER